MESNSILDRLISLATEEELIQHGIGGYLYARGYLDGSDRARQEWQKNYLHNHLMMEEWGRLMQSTTLESLQPAFLKGASLIHRVYPSYGERSMSDLDLWLPRARFAEATDQLCSAGYHCSDETKWLGNRHKQVLINNQSERAIVIELHSQLFYTSNKAPEIQRLDSSQVSAFCLTPEWEFVHLCGHLAFQHTFRKLFWLVDIIEFLKTFELDWQKVFAIAEEQRVLTSLRAILRIVGEESKGPGVSRLLSSLLSADFLVQPLRQKWRYYLVKSLLKDQFTENIRYNFKWMQQSLKSV